jgi:uncharacterized DUF497 family protein
MDKEQQFEWDSEKAKENKEKHSLSFELAKECFFYNYIKKLDTRHDYKEDRYQIIGRTKEPKLILFVVYTLRNRKVRIISARKANKKEREVYYDFCSKDKRESK